MDSQLQLLQIFSTRRTEVARAIRSSSSGSFKQSQVAQSLVCELVARAKQVADLLEREPDALRRIDDREATKHSLVIAALARRSLRLGQESAGLVIANA